MMATSRESSYLHSGKSSSASSSPNRHHKSASSNHVNYQHSNYISNNSSSKKSASVSSSQLNRRHTELSKSSPSKSKPPDGSEGNRTVIVGNHIDSDLRSFRSSLPSKGGSNFCDNRTSSTAEAFTRSASHRDQLKDTSPITSATFDLIKYSSDLSRQQQHSSHADLSGRSQLSPPSSYSPSSSPAPVLTPNSAKVQQSTSPSASYSHHHHHRQLATAKSASSPSRPPTLISGYHDDDNPIFELYKPSSNLANEIQSESPPPPPQPPKTSTKFPSSTNGWSKDGVIDNSNNNNPSNRKSNNSATNIIYSQLEQSIVDKCAAILSNNGDSQLVVNKKTIPAATNTTTSAASFLPLSGSALTLTSALANCVTSINNQNNNNQASNNNNNNTGSQSTSPMPASISIGNEPLAQLLFTLKEQNKSLIREIEDLRIKLEDAEGDLKLVRCQMRSMSKQMDTVAIESSRDRIIDENILNELEFYKDKVLLLERDCQSLLDEKEELILTKDDLQLKNQRLNEQLLGMMRNLSEQSGNYEDTNSLLFDVDSLYLENRYLKEKIKNEEDERRLLLTRLAKYKELMERHSNDSTASNHKKKYFSSNSNSNTSDTSMETVLNAGGRVLNTRDVEQLISSESIHSMEVNKSNQMYLWNLLVALFGELQSKNMNLVHARKTNHFLGKHVEELESTIRPFESDNLDRAQSKQIYRVKSPLLSGADSVSSRSTPTNNTATSSTTNNNAINVPNPHRKDPLHPHPHPHPHPHHHSHQQHHILDNGLLRQTDTDGNISSSATATTLTTAKETSEEENDNEDDLSSTGISTPSTARRSLSIEQHLQALQNDALDMTPLKQPLKQQHDPKATFNSIRHHHGSHGSTSAGSSGGNGGAGHSSNHLYDFKRDFDKHKTPTGLY